MGCVHCAGGALRYRDLPMLSMPRKRNAMTASAMIAAQPITSYNVKGKNVSQSTRNPAKKHCVSGWSVSQSTQVLSVCNLLVHQR